MRAELENARAFDAALLKLRTERPDLAAFLVPLPAKEPPRLTRARMAELIQRTVAFSGNVTRTDLEAAGFSDSEIAEHFTKARRLAQVEKLVA